MAAQYEQIMDKAADEVRRAGAEAVFGRPREAGGTIIIPVARLSYGWGAGGGKGMSPKQTQEGEGGGAGVGAKVVPMGFVWVKGDKLSYKPIVDSGKLIMILTPIIGWLTYRLVRSILPKAR